MNFNGGGDTWQNNFYDLTDEEKRTERGRKISATKRAHPFHPSTEQIERQKETMRKYRREHPELREKLSKAAKGKHPSKESLEKKSESLKKHYTEHPEAKKAISERLKKEYAEGRREKVFTGTPWNKGLHWEAMKGENNPMSRPEVKEKHKAIVEAKNKAYKKWLSELKEPVPKAWNYFQKNVWPELRVELGV